ncbi:DUF3862 domain-containing protein, partial [Enterococcus hirae]|nr:DUF3862 domain-containing protein [Enterococcus hirae]
VGLILGWGIKTIEVNNKVAQKEESEKAQQIDIKSAQYLEKEYNSIIVSDKKNLDKKSATSIKELKKKLGEPVYSENTTIDNITVNTKTWSIGANNELPANLTVNTIDGVVVEKSISNLYVNYNAKLLVTKNKYNEITLNKDLSFEQAKKEFGNPNAVNEYIDDYGKTVISATWNTNVKGAIGSFFNVTFVNNVATSKTEVGLAN